MFQRESVQQSVQRSQISIQKVEMSKEAAEQKRYFAPVAHRSLLNDTENTVIYLDSLIYEACRNN